MFEGHAPFKPRYVLPDYARFLANGSQWLELEGAKDLDDALSLLTILYHHVPSVTSMPVYLGQLDALLQPYVRILTQDAIDIRIKRFWRYLDRTLPDAFMHANIGPADTPVTRAILRADAELKQVTPNLTFIYDAEITPDDLLLEVAKNICECSKPHISNGPVNDKIFTKGHYGIVSCYNSLPLGGGGSTLVRLNLKAWQNAVRLSMTSFHARYRTTADSRSPSLIHDVNSSMKSHISLRIAFLYRKV